MINAYYDELEPISIVMDDEKGGYIQTEHLIQLGHTNIAGFFKSDDIQGSRRMKGFLKAHRANGIPINPNSIITYTSNEKTTKPSNELTRLLRDTNPPTAIVCYNDELAIKLLDVLRDKGLKVPDDLSIIGYDDSFLADLTEVKLSTVRHPQSEMGQKAAEVILDLIKLKDGNIKNEKVESIVFEPKLILRNSTKKI